MVDIDSVAGIGSGGAKGDADAGEVELELGGS